MKERNLDLVPRAEETREKNRTIPNIVKFKLNEIEQHFNENLILQMNFWKMREK